MLRPFACGSRYSSRGRATLWQPHAGGDNCAHYPKELQADFQARIGAAGSRSEALAEAIYWPYELSKLGKSDLLRDWLEAAKLTCGTYDEDALGVFKGFAGEAEEEGRVLDGSWCSPSKGYGAR